MKEHLTACPGRKRPVYELQTAGGCPLPGAPPPPPPPSDLRRVRVEVETGQVKGHAKALKKLREAGV